MENSNEKVVYINGKPSLTASLARLLDNLNGTDHSKLFEKDDRKAIESDWKAVGDDMKSILYGNKYEQ